MALKGNQRVTNLLEESLILRNTQIKKKERHGHRDQKKHPKPRAKSRTWTPSLHWLVLGTPGLCLYPKPPLGLPVGFLLNQPKRVPSNNDTRILPFG